MDAPRIATPSSQRDTERLQSQMIKAGVHLLCKILFQNFSDASRSLRSQSPPWNTVHLSALIPPPSQLLKSNHSAVTTVGCLGEKTHSSSWFARSWRRSTEADWLQQPPEHQDFERENYTGWHYHCSDVYRNSFSSTGLGGWLCPSQERKGDVEKTTSQLPSPRCTSSSLAKVQYQSLTLTSMFSNTHTQEWILSTQMQK